MKLSMKGFLILSLICMTTNSFTTSEEVSDIHDLCRHNRHMDDRYMEENSSFQLNIRSSAKSDSNDKLLLKKHKSKCSLTFKLCSSCHMTIFIKNMIIPPCSYNCSCNHFSIREPLSYFTSKKYCGERSQEIMYFESLTKVVHFDFVQSVHKTFYVSITFNVSRNVYFFMENSNSRSRYIETPYFPSKYPSDYTAEYHFQAFPPNGCVLLVFSDFLLSRWSYIEVSGHNGTMSEMFYGDKARPPVVLSDGPSLSVRFVASDQIPQQGFRATYTFHQKTNGALPIVPNTACGGSKHDESGIIQLIIPEAVSRKELYDCIWIINPPSFVEPSQFTSVTVVEFGNIGNGSSIEFRKGPTSKSSVMFQCEDLITCGVDMLNKELIAAAHTGVYIHFQGHVDRESSIMIYYYTFRENNCTSKEYACGDGKCISASLVCDGHNHCSDGHDENDCFNHTEVTQARPSNIQTSIAPELEFPKKEKFMFQSATEFVVFSVVGSCGILIFVISVSMVIYTHMKEERILPHDFPPLEIVETTPEIGLSQRAPPPRMNRYRLPFRDRPPSYDHVMSFDQMYPPLFYTRAQNHAETCMNQGVLPSPAASQASLPSLLCGIPSNSLNLGCKEVVINLSAASSEGRSFGLCFVRRMLKRSLSLGSALDKLQYESPAISFCAPTPAENSTVDFNPGCSIGLKPTDMQCHIASFVAEQDNAQCSFQPEMSPNIGVVLAPEHHNIPFRKKTSSF